MLIIPSSHNIGGLWFRKIYQALPAKLLRSKDIAQIYREYLLSVYVVEYCTFVALGCLQACFIKSSEAKWVLLMTRSSEGPISSNSTRGT